MNRERALRQQLIDSEEALALQQKLLHEQIEIATAAAARAERAERELAALIGEAAASAAPSPAPAADAQAANGERQVVFF
eukprot:4845844-Prymnesium_polylepis.2